MNANHITCPNCQHQFNLDEDLKKKYQELEQNLQTKLKDQEEKIKSEYRQKAMDWAEKKAKEEAQKAIDQKMKESQMETKDLKNQLAEKEKKEKEFLDKELELRQKTREIEEKAKTQQLELARKLDEERKKITEQAKVAQAEETRLKMQEKDKQMEIMRKTIEDLKRKSEQGSMQIQGEVQENDLKDILKEAFPFDKIEDVPTGIKGGDIVQTVQNRLGQKIGVILWESKNTKAWSDGWLKKLKADQEKVRADTCILVSQVVPEGVNGFDFIKNVWVSEYKFIIPLIGTIRMQLEETHNIKKSMAGQDEKMNQLSEYLSGNQFKNRVENMVLSFAAMKDELEKERRAMERIWSRREKEIGNVLTNTAGMYGDLQGIMGNSLPEVESLELPSA